MPPTATPTPTPTPEPFKPLTPEQVRDLLAELARRPGLGGKRTTPDGTAIISTVDELFQIFETGHYLLTGEPTRWIPRVLTRQEYDKQARERKVAKSIGYCCERTDAGLEVIMKGSEPAGLVLGVIAHEAGHARQQILNPDQHGSHQMRALHEAQAQAFTGAFIRSLGAYAGVNAKWMPMQYNLSTWIANKATSWVAALDDPNEIHRRGEAILWGAVLSDPELSDLGTELMDSRMLSAESMLRLHEYLVAISRDDADQYVDDMLAAFRRNVQAIEQTLRGRAAAIPNEGFFKHNFSTLLYP